MMELYSSAYYLIKHRFSYKETLENFCAFGDRVTIAINTCDDGTWDALNQYKLDNNAKHLNLLSCDYDRNDPLFDGKVKNFALQHTILPYKMGLDMDEKVLLSSKEKWIKLGELLEKSNKYKSVLIPSLDLWGDKNSIRWDLTKNICIKWYLGLAGLQRGPIREARLPNGKLDIIRSDSCELILPNGEIAPYTSTISPDFWHRVKDNNEVTQQTFNEYIEFLKQSGLYILHFGYLNFEKRIHRNKEWWKQQWEISSGKESDIPMHQTQLFHPTFQHNLPLE